MSDATRVWRDKTYVRVVPFSHHDRFACTALLNQLPGQGHRRLQVLGYLV